MSELPLEWRVKGDDPRGGVIDAAVAWCSCGWRYAEGCYSRKDNRERARLMFALHRERWCPVALLPPADVEGARLAPSLSGRDE